MHFLLILGVICVLAWTYLLLAHGEFWRVERLPLHTSEAALPAGSVAVVIPARNEADVIGKAIDSLLQQALADALRIFVVDDNSTDATAEVARQAALLGARPDAVTVIAGAPLPPGWSGKLWAVHQGIEQALAECPDYPDYLLLTDADVHHSPDNVARIVGIARNGDYDLASFMVKLHCRSLAERLLIPAFVFFFFMLYPPKWIRDPRYKTSGAAGGCILLRPAALKRAGGLAAVRNAVIDDCALAGVIKRSGGRVWLGATPDTCSVRTYPSLGAIEHMIARTAFNQLRHSGWLLAGAITGLGLTFLLPVVLLLSGSLMVGLLGVASWMMMVTAYLPMVRFYGLNPLWGLTLPFSATFYMAATVHSAIKYWMGKGGEWKGRAQDLS